MCVMTTSITTLKNTATCTTTHQFKYASTIITSTNVAVATTAVEALVVVMEAVMGAVMAVVMEVDIRVAQ